MLMFVVNVWKQWNLNPIANRKGVEVITMVIIRTEVISIRVIISHDHTEVRIEEIKGHKVQKLTGEATKIIIRVKVTEVIEVGASHIGVIEVTEEETEVI